MEFNECLDKGCPQEDLAEVNRFREFLKERKQLRDKKQILSPTDYKIDHHFFIEKWKEYLCPSKEENL